MSQKKKKTWNWKQIKQVVKDIYMVEAHKDNWGVPVIYESSMIPAFKKRLSKIKEYIK